MHGRNSSLPTVWAGVSWTPPPPSQFSYPIHITSINCVTLVSFGYFITKITTIPPINKSTPHFCTQFHTLHAVMAQTMLLTANNVVNGEQQLLIQRLKPTPFSQILLPPRNASPLSSSTTTVALFKSKTKAAPPKKVVF